MSNWCPDCGEPAEVCMAYGTCPLGQDRKRLAKQRQEVITIHQGFEIKAWRTQALGGWDNLYFYIMRQSDGWFLEDNFTTGDDDIGQFVEYLKARVEDYLANPDDYEDEEI